MKSVLCSHVHWQRRLSSTLVYSISKLPRTTVTLDLLSTYFADCLRACCDKSTFITNLVLTGTLHGATENWLCEDHKPSF